MDIRKMPIRYNTSSRQGKKIEYIVIHDTGNKSVGATALNHYHYFNGANRNASAHYFVDDKEVIQTVPDNLAAWHCGDGRGRHGITNANSIGIELCVNADGGYNKAYGKTIQLTRHLMDLHSIPLDKVVRHYDASRKNCPASMSANNWQLWTAFKAALDKQEKEGIKVNIKGRLHHMDGVFQNDKNYVSVRELAEALGHNVTWDKSKQTVVIR